MSKRFTDTDKWKHDWFLSLDNDSRIVYQYLIDNCSHAGLFKKQYTHLNMVCKTNHNEDSLKKLFAKKIIDVGEYFFIPTFLKHQYKNGLQSNKPVIVSVRNELLKHNLNEIIVERLGNNFSIIKDKDKDKDIKGGGVGEGKVKLFPISGKTCCRKGCGLPAVYKNPKGEYDTYYCGEHMPEKIKNIYAW
jgi:hypothetical protein